MEIKYEKAVMGKRFPEYGYCFVVLHGHIDGVERLFPYKVSLELIDTLDAKTLESFLGNLFVRRAKQELRELPKTNV